MGFTMVQYFEDLDQAALGNVAGVADDHVNVQGDNIRIPDVMSNLAGVYAGGASITLARMASPSLRDTINPDIAPLDQANEPSSPYGWLNLFHTPIPMKPGDNLRGQAAEGGGTTQLNLTAFLSDGPVTAVSGDISTVRATGTTTLTADAWSSVALTFGQELPVGRYQLVGMRAISAGLIAARVIVPGFPWRPGCIGLDDEGDIEDPVFRAGRLGVWAEFDTTQLFQAECFAISADTAETFYFDIIRVGDL